MLQLFACDPVRILCLQIGQTESLKTSMPRIKHKTAQFNHVTLECHGIAVLDKNSALTSRKVYRKSSLSTMLALGKMKVYR